LDCNPEEFIDELLVSHEWGEANRLLWSYARQNVNLELGGGPDFWNACKIIMEERRSVDYGNIPNESK